MGRTHLAGASRVIYHEPEPLRILPPVFIRIFDEILCQARRVKQRWLVHLRQHIFNPEPVDKPRCDAMLVVSGYRHRW